MCYELFRLSTTKWINCIVSLLTVYWQNNSLFIKYFSKISYQTWEFDILSEVLVDIWHFKLLDPSWHTNFYLWIGSYRIEFSPLIVFYFIWMANWFLVPFVNIVCIYFHFLAYRYDRSTTLNNQSEIHIYPETFIAIHSDLKQPC